MNEGFHMNHLSQVVLYAEDDDDDAFFVRRAFEQAGITHRLVVVEDGKTAIEYVSGNGSYADRAQHPLPCFVLLDLNMPGVSGIDVLKFIRTTPSVCTMPVVVLTSSNQDRDVHRAYLQGANGYLIKPRTLEEFTDMAKAIKHFWLTLNRVSAWKEVPQGAAGHSTEN
jgi:CheY-like chemotaxis protein